jgi:Ser/Thr protein kinase RdoA (MazF antagonist)
MVDVDNVVPFLLERGLVQSDWIISGDLAIRSAARRNRNLRVEGPGGAGYLIKQPDEIAPESRRTLGNEAAFYEFCQQEKAAAPVAAFLPRLVLRDQAQAIHALVLIEGARSLAACRLAQSAEAFPVESSRTLGQGLGTLHRVFRLPRFAGDPRLAWLTQSVPWIFRSNRRPTPAMLASLSPAGARVFQILRSEPDVGAALERLSSRWRAETVIHGDIKSDNVLTGPPRQGRAAGDAGVWIVDWEFVQIGDPAWDVAAALHDDIVFWTSTMPQDPALSAEERIEQARCPLDVLKPATRALWEGYRQAAALDRGGAEAEDLLGRAVAFSAARLILAAHELSLEQDDISVQAVLLLQIGMNLLTDPESGQINLYGIPRENGLQ